jgi:aminoglycoside/choline kinase family phosphotransferase
MDDREALKRRFVAGAGWGDAELCFLAGDASNRKYDRLRRGNARAVLMDAPPEKGEETAPFLAIAAHLRALGLSAPACFAADGARGFLLIEDLGDDLFARLLERRPGLEPVLYDTAAEVLAVLQAAPPPGGLEPWDTAAMADAATLALRWYALALTGRRPDPGLLRHPVADAIDALAPAAPVLVLRDYHAENLLWLPDRPGPARVGLLDFQTAGLGRPEYDLISMLQDARRDVRGAIIPGTIRCFADATGRAEADILPALAALGAQRALRIIGVFARLSLHYGRPGYARLIPRVWGQLEENLAHPALAGLRRVVERELPRPTPQALARIVDQCGMIPAP